MQMKGNQVCKEIKHACDLGFFQLMWLRINCTQRPEKTSVLPENGYRNITLKTIHARCMMPAKVFIFLHIVNYNLLVCLSDFITNRRLQFQLPTRFKAK